MTGADRVAGRRVHGPPIWSGPRVRWTLAVALGCALIFGLSGCSGPDRSSGRGTFPARTSTEEVMVRTDAKPITDRFPQLGQPAELHWAGGRRGPEGSSDVPGPTDVWIQGVLHLAEADADRLRNGYQWESLPADSFPPDLHDKLRPYLPATRAWEHSDGFDRELLGNRYTGVFYFERTSGTVSFSVTSR